MLYIGFAIRNPWSRRFEQTKEHFNGNIVEDCEEESLESLMVVEDEFGELMYL